MKSSGLLVPMMCAFFMVQGLCGTMSRPSLADDPAPLPDLVVDFDEGSFSVDGIAGPSAVKGSLVQMTALVLNVGAGNVTSATASFFCDTAFIGTVPVLMNFSGWPDLGYASFVWDTSYTGLGNHTIRAEVNATGGDANDTNNSAEAVFTVTAAPPTVVLDLDSTQLNAVVTESSVGMVSFSGSVRLNGLEGARAAVYITAELDTGWPCSLSPSTIVFISDGTMGFEVTVVVPEKTRADILSRLSVNATAEVPGSRVNATVSALVGAQPYYKVEVASDRPYIEVAPANQAVFKLNVENKGNSVDSYEIEIANLADLVNRRWTLMLSEAEVNSVAPGETRVVNLVAQSPEDYTLWKSEPTVIVVKATSMGAKDQSTLITQSYPVYVYEKGSYPAFYNYWTVGLAIVMIAAAAVALVWRWRSKKKSPQINPGLPLKR